MKNVCATLILFVVALGLDYGLLSSLSDKLGFFAGDQARLTAMVVIVIGLRGRELAGLGAALLLALLAAPLSGQGHLGAMLISFSVCGFLAGTLGRWSYSGTFWIRLPLLFSIIVLEGWLCSIVRYVFWTDLHVEIQWMTHATVAVVATLLTALRRERKP